MTSERGEGFLAARIAMLSTRFHVKSPPSWPERVES